MNVLTDFVNGGGEGLVGFEFDGLNIGQSITKNDLYEAISILDNVETIEVLDPATSEEISEIECSTTTSVLKLNTVTINQTVIE